MMTLLSTALRHFLNTSRNAPQLLKPLQHKVVALNIQGIKTFYFLFTDDVKVTTEHSGIIHTTISGPPFSLLMMIKQKNMVGSGLTIQGEAETAEALKNLLSALDIDWEEQLASFTGDVAAYHMGAAFRTVLRGAKKTTSRLQQMTADYLIEEKRLSVSQTELENFYDEVDQLRLSIERLEARLKQQTGKKHGP